MNNGPAETIPIDGLAHPWVRVNNCKTHVEDGQSVLAGTFFGLASLDVAKALQASIMLVAASDTESCRCGRWRIKKRIPAAIPVMLSFLNTGRRAGRFLSSKTRSCFASSRKALVHADQAAASSG
jgi:hypothetical protein